MTEVFQDIPGYNWIYQASNLWRIKSLLKDKIMKPYKIYNDYLIISLHKEWERNNKFIHRIILVTFDSSFDIDSLFEVNHKDWRKDNNALHNLEYCTRKQNIRHAYKNWLCENNIFKKRNPFKNMIGSLNSKSKKVKQFTKEEDFIREWNSLKEASLSLNIQRTSISSCCLWKQKMAGWFIWKFTT